MTKLKEVILKMWILVDSRFQKNNLQTANNSSHKKHRCLRSNKMIQVIFSWNHKHYKHNKPINLIQLIV